LERENDRRPSSKVCANRFLFDTVLGRGRNSTLFAREESMVRGVRGINPTATLATQLLGMIVSLGMKWLSCRSTAK
jgi:hypothetical protein